MIIQQITPLKECLLHVIAEDGREGTFDVTPFLESPAFAPLKNWGTFSQIHNGKYFIEWMCGADLSADTLEARMQWAE